MKIAVIDLGSNSARMDIVKIYDNGFEILEDYRQIVRLSEGLSYSKVLKTEALDRTLKVLKEFKGIIDKHGITEVKAIATAAMRMAENKESLLIPAAELGINFEIISGEKEAYFDYMSVVNSLNIKDCVVIDIGGASTELILVKDGLNVNSVSIPLAAVNITEKYFSSDIADDKELSCAVDDFTKQLKSLNWLSDAKKLPCVGLGGTIRAVSMMKCNNLLNLHGFSMSKSSVFDMIYKLIKMPVSKRSEIDGIGTGRADIILGGVVPLIAVMDYINSEELVACLTGLREGVIYDFIKK